MKFIAIGIILLIASCSTSVAQEQHYTYRYQNDTLSQQLEVRYLNRKEIRFSLVVKNTLRKTEAHVAGVATGNPDQDAELDGDEYGEMYPSVEFFFEKDCSLSIRIALEDRMRAVVLESGCGNLHGRECPFGSVEVMKRVPDAGKRKH